MTTLFNKTDLDTILALAGAILSLALIAYLRIHVGQLIYVITGIISFLACVTYLVLKWRQKLPDASSIADLQAKPLVLSLLDIAFFALFAYNLWSLAFRPEVYVRPIGYFVSIALMSATLAAKILLLPSKNWRTPFALFQIVLIALSLEWSVLLLYPSIIGADPWYHQAVTMDMLGKGHIVEGSHRYLVIHLAIGETSLITALNYKMATMLSICFLQVVCDVLFIFLIGRLLFNAKIGLLAALLTGVANWHIFFGYWTIPNALGATFVVIILYLLLKFHKEKVTMVIPVFGLLMLALVLTHAIAALWLSILLFASWLGFVVYNKLFKKRLATLVPLAIALLFTVSMFGYWTFGPGGHMRTLARLVGIGFEPGSGVTLTYPVAQAPPELTPAASAAWETLSGAPSAEFLFNSSGMFLFFAISFIGCFYMLSRRVGNPYAFFLAIAGVLILSIGYFPMLMGLSVIEHRWWYMAQILLSIPLAVAFYLLSGLSKKRYLKAGLMAISVFVLAFLMIMGLPSNMDNRTFSQNQLARYALTTSELQAMDTVSANYEGIIGTDGYYKYASSYTPELSPTIKNRLESISPCLLANNFTQCSCRMILIRDEIVVHPIGTGQGTIYRLNYDPRQVLTKQGVNKVYDCNSVSGFSR